MNIVLRTELWYAKFRSSCSSLPNFHIALSFTVAEAVQDGLTDFSAWTAVQQLWSSSEISVSAHPGWALRSVFYHRGHFSWIFEKSSPRATRRFPPSGRGSILEEFRRLNGSMMDTVHRFEMNPNFPPSRQWQCQAAWLQGLPSRLLEPRDCDTPPSADLSLRGSTM